VRQIRLDDRRPPIRGSRIARRRIWFRRNDPAADSVGLAGSVFAAGHSCEALDIGVGEPYGTLVLALASR